MCRYREYHYACGDVEIETPPYLPCCTDDFCTPDSSSDPPIKIKKNTPCGSPTCEASDGTIAAHNVGGGTSWSLTNSKHRGNGAGEEGDPGARLRHTVSTKMKVAGLAKLARSMTKKKNAQPKTNGAEDFFTNGGNEKYYEEIGSEMEDLKK